MDDLILNPYFQIILGIVLIIMGVINLRLTPRRFLGGLSGGLAGLFSEPTEKEKRLFQEKPLSTTIPGGCLLIIFGFVIFISGVVRLLV